MLSNFDFLYPDFIYLNIILILPLLLYFLSKNTFKKHFSKEILKKLSINQSYISSLFRIILLSLIFALFTIALARPIKHNAKININIKGLNIIMALDISKSMLAQDSKPSRLIVAKDKIKKFIDINRHNKIALMGFAGNSFMVAPFSHDSDSLKFLIDNLDIGSVSQKGTNILSVLESSLIIDKSDKLKNIIIFSDGGDQKDYQKEINFAKDNNIVVHILAIGSEKGAPIKEDGKFITDKNGAVVISKRNNKIARLSHESKGIFSTYTYSNKDIEILSDYIEKQNKKELFKKDKITSHDEYFIYPLLASMVLVFLSFFTYLSRAFNVHNIHYLLIFTLFTLYPNNAKAGIFDFMEIDNAKKSYKKNEFQKSIKQWKSLYDKNKGDKLSYNLANAYYKNNEFNKSIEYFNKTNFKTDKAKAFLSHNKGNAYAKIKDYDNAIKQYEKSLAIRDDKDTAYNLKLVKEQKKKQDKKKKQNKDKKDNLNNKDENQGNKDQNDGRDNKNKTNNKDKKDKSKSEQNKGKDKQKGNKDEGNNKKKKDKEKSEQNKGKHQEKEKAYKAKQISKIEEKRWLKKLQKQKAKVVPLYKFNTKHNNKGNYNDKNW